MYRSIVFILGIGVTFASNSVSIKTNPFSYSSEYTDSESGLQYLQVRYYKPDLMRFVQRDSYSLMNRYAYTNNPIMEIDPTGHMEWSNFFSSFLCSFTSSLEDAARISTISEIESGNFLGRGSYGEAYKHGDTVYKIYTESVPGWMSLSPDSVVQRWNEYYSKEHYGQMFPFATAKLHTIEGKEVLQTPFIEGDNVYGTSQEMLGGYEHEINSFTRDYQSTEKRFIYDYSAAGNLKLYRRSQSSYILPVDFDAAFELPGVGNEFKPEEIKNKWLYYNKRLRHDKLQYYATDFEIDNP